MKKRDKGLSEHDMLEVLVIHSDVRNALEKDREV